MFLSWQIHKYSADHNLSDYNLSGFVCFMQETWVKVRLRTTEQTTLTKTFSSSDRRKEEVDFDLNQAWQLQSVFTKVVRRPATDGRQIEGKTNLQCFNCFSSPSRSILEIKRWAHFIENILPHLN